MAKIVIACDTRALAAAITETQRLGREYAAEAVAVLRDQYHAAVDQIDLQTFAHGPTGYLAICGATGTVPQPPAQWLAETLACYSDVGLAACGLTRQQYEAARRALVAAGT